MKIHVFLSCLMISGPKTIKIDEQLEIQKSESFMKNYWGVPSLRFGGGIFGVMS